jgi:molecular chaperone HscA
MTLLQIHDPELEQTPEPEWRSAVGIDLGTTNSLVVQLDKEGIPHLLKEPENGEIIPSVVHYPLEGEALVGSQARQLTNEDPVHTILSIKRIMGKSLDEISDYRTHYPYEFDPSELAVPRLRMRGRSLAAVEVSAEILRYLRTLVENQKGEELEGAVITVPAYFDDSQRQATKDAARLAGISVLRLLNEPTAAAVAYGLDHEAEGVHAVFDLGGGTFDITILRFARGVFEVLSTRGDTELGGDDFDQKIIDWITSQMAFGQECSKAFFCRLRATAKSAREALSTQESVELNVHCPCGDDWKGTLTRDHFNQLIDPLVDQAILSCRRALLDAGLTPEEIIDVVMVGGATRTPRVREKVEALFGRPPKVSIDPDRVVAIGAAIQADRLIGNRRDDTLLLLDVLPLSLGLETMGGLVERIVPRNTSLPVTRSQEFTTFKDGQTAMSIHVVQGERELVDDNRSLARFELRNIPPIVAGAAKVRVTFQVDADGILNVTASELTTGVESRIEVKPSYGLTENEIETMLHDSFSHAREDVNLRNLREQQIEVDRILSALDSAIELDGERLLSNEERTLIEQAASALKERRAASEARLSTPLETEALNSDVTALREGLRRLERVSRSFIMQRMNRAMTDAMAGQSVDSVDFETPPSHLNTPSKET